LEMKKVLRTLSTDDKHFDAKGPLCFSPNGKLLAVNSGQDKIGQAIVTMWDVAEGKPQSKLIGHLHLDARQAFSPDGTTVFVGGSSPKGWVVREHDAMTGKFLREFSPKEYPSAIAISPDGKTIVTGGWETISFTDAATGNELSRITMKRFLDLAFTPDGKS